jgi:peptide/nickel transport system substrate-binding protein
MHRRAFLKTAAGARAIVATGGLASPAISQRAAGRTLRFVPQADLSNFDPIWGTTYAVRNAAAMVWDMLYGVDANLRPQRQMVESEEVSADGLTWAARDRNLSFVQAPSFECVKTATFGFSHARFNSWTNSRYRGRWQE